MTNNKFKAIQIRKKWHNKISVMAAFHDVKMKVLASKIIACMFEKHKEEIDAIVEELKIKKT